MRNKYPSNCDWCQSQVPAGCGRILTYSGANKFLGKELGTHRSSTGRRFRIRCAACEPTTRSKKTFSGVNPDACETRLRLMEVGL